MASSIDRGLADAVELVPNLLYWATLNSPTLPRDTPRTHFFSTDNNKIFQYEPFFADFGPLNLGQTYRYCKMLDDILKDPTKRGKKIIHCCSADPKKRSNSAYLICSYLVIIQRQSAENAFAPFNFCQPPLMPYRDATASPVSVFPLTVQDCLHGLEHSIRMNLFDWERFNVESYEFFEKVENGDMSWVLPGRMLAFAGPYPTNRDEQGYPTWTPEDYVPLFQDAGINLVVRLNRKMYDKKRFVDHNIKHVDLYFPDGTCPSREIIGKFLHIAENERGPIAIHCKAGLGRTGTLIGLYAMKHLRFPARAFIGWNRICRPGSILGPQQQFLCDMEALMFQGGTPSPLTSLISHDLDEATQRLQQLGLRELRPEEVREDYGQGEGLCNAKRAVQGRA
mmetsp:Transcript_58125/g.123428  ORF Transcript_58125/g.123428 Transcript_58125/m.123428 type:complete len:395 (-) Transcript_58125:118-1302(-)